MFKHPCEDSKQPSLASSSNAYLTLKPDLFGLYGRSKKKFDMPSGNDKLRSHDATCSGFSKN